MARMNKSQKAQRVLELAMGLREPEVQQALAPYGFGPEVLEEAFELMAAAVRTVKPLPAEDTRAKLVAAFAAFESRWFPIVRYALDRHHPRIAKQLFAGLARTAGITTIVTVQSLVERVHALERGEHGAEGSSARELLAKRGLTPDVVTQAEELLRELARVAKPVGYRVSGVAVDDTGAEEALWRWYLEWGGIARVVIKERRLLRALGFRKNQSDEPDLELESVPAASDLPT